MLTPPINSFVTPAPTAIINDPWFYNPNSHWQRSSPADSEPIVLSANTDPTPVMDSTNVSEATNLPMMDVNIPDLPPHT